MHFRIASMQLQSVLSISSPVFYFFNSKVTGLCIMPILLINENLFGFTVKPTKFRIKKN